MVQITKLQNEVLDILRFIHKKCRQNNLRYYLAHEALLGANRHMGFIPRDDDIDLVAHEFDGENFFGPKEGDNKLTEIYNDYVISPPINQQINAHQAHIVKWPVNYQLKTSCPCV